MQYLGNDTDDLFREAAENYPLNRNGADWEKVYSHLTEEYKRPVLSFARISGYKAVKYMWLLLLIPLSFLVSKFGGDSVNISSEKLVKKPPETSQQTQQVHPSLPANSSKIPLAQSRKPISVEERAPSHSGDVILSDNLSSNDDPVSNRTNTDNIASLKQLKEDQLITRQEIGAYQSALQQPETLKQEAGLSNQIQSVPPAAVLPEILMNSAEMEDASQVPSTVKEPVTLKKPKKFYIGLVVAPDLTTVKFQSVKKVGLNVGVLMGYQFDHKINGELGVLLDSKYYYTEAKFFNGDAIKKNLVSVNGFSSITEIPLSIRYNFSTKPSSQFFASAGAVSYIIHNEKYSYVYNKDGVLYSGEKQVKKSSFNWFSNLQVSVGYEHQLGKVGDFRIEPYYRIPVKGVGLGNIPVTSLGINFGITRKIK